MTYRRATSWFDEGTDHMPTPKDPWRWVALIVVLVLLFVGVMTLGVLAMRGGA